MSSIHAKIHLPPYWSQAIAELSAADEVLAGIIRNYDGEGLTSKNDPFHTLARAIVGQQISVKAADAVWNRLASGLADYATTQISGRNIPSTTMPDNNIITPAAILAQPDDALRSHGLSRQKIVYLKDLSCYFHEQPRICDDWVHMDDESLIASLTTIRGIGRWTAEMFLIFHLLRPDVFPVDDIGLQKAVWKHYFHGDKQPLKTLRQKGELWRPWRSVATWYLWRSLDPVAVEY